MWLLGRFTRLRFVLVSRNHTLPGGGSAAKQLGRAFTEVSFPHTSLAGVFFFHLFIKQLDQSVLGNVVLGGSARGKAHLFVGNIAELLVFDRRLDALESERVEAYLGRKWGLD